MVRHSAFGKWGHRHAARRCTQKKICVHLRAARLCPTQLQIGMRQNKIGLAIFSDKAVCLAQVRLELNAEANESSQPCGISRRKFQMTAVSSNDYIGQTNERRISNDSAVTSAEYTRKFLVVKIRTGGR